MPLDRLEILHAKANELLCWMAERSDQYNGFGSMTCAIYDTAWVSMVAKEVDGELQWLFPQSFQFVLNAQDVSGGWISGTSGSEIDSILNSMAALLALRKHASAPGPRDGGREDLLMKMSRGAAFVQNRLRSWDVESTAHVGFELLVPAILDSLEEAGFVFDFAGREMLLEIKNKKMARIRPEMLYSNENVNTALIHSLEAFAGQMDLHGVAHHKDNGSMMGSPASTAAYMIYTSSWDDEAEEYLRDVIAAGPGKGNGSVPSAYPSSLFEISWVIYTLSIGDFDLGELGGKPLNALRDVLGTAFDNGSGLVGFAPSVAADADDTAKGITALKMLGTFVSAEGMVKEYEDGEYFKTYPCERNSSFSTNCNVLIALLNTSRPMDFKTQIEKIVRYLCKTWEERGNDIRDKWNVSPLYSMMLMTQALTQVLVWESDSRLHAVVEKLTEESIVRTLWEALICTLQAQKEDGSWENTREVTAYAVLTINALIPLHKASPFRHQMDSAIASARRYLWPQLDSDDPEYLWIEKVTYGVSTLSQAYVLAALNCSAATYELPHCPTDVSKDANHPQIARLYSRMPLLSTTAEWRIQAWQIQANFFTSHIRQVGVTIFPHSATSDNKYAGFIPFSWIAGNNLIQPAPLVTDILVNMMELSLLIYQVDEVMEGPVALQPESYLAELKDDIDKVFDVIETECARAPEQPKSYANGSVVLPKSATETDDSMTTIFDGTGENHICADYHIPSKDLRKTATEVNSMCPAEIIESLNRFVRFVLLHPNVQKARENSSK